MSVYNTKILLQIHYNSVLSGRHVSTFTWSSSGPQRKQIQDYIDFFFIKCIVGSQMLTGCVIKVQ